MKEPIEYISGEILEKCYGYAEDVLLAIKEAQKDAYNQAIEDSNRQVDKIALDHTSIMFIKNSIFKLNKL